MSTGAEGTQEPTQQDAMALGQAAAAGATNPGQQTPQDAAAAAVDREAEARNLRISDEDKKQIAAMAAQMAASTTIDQLEKRGAFDPPPSAAPPAAAPPQAGAPATEGTGPPPAPAGDEGKPPVKDSWAKRHGFG